MAGRFAHTLEDGRLLCSFCPRRCRLLTGGTGLCGALRNDDGELRLRRAGAPFRMRISPVESSGLTRFSPGTAFLSVESAGSGLGAESAPDETDFHSAPWVTAEEAVFLARTWNCRGVYLATDDPVFGASDGFEILERARASGLGTALRTTGYLLPRGREILFSHADAVNLVLYGVSPALYRRRFGARPEPVLETVEWLRNRPAIHVEVTIPLLSGENDREADIERLSRWIEHALGPGTPVHFVTSDRWTDDATGPARAAKIAKKAGLTEVEAVTSLPAGRTFLGDLAPLPYEVPAEAS